MRTAGSDVRAEADEIQAAIDQERETASGVGVLDMVRDPVDRRTTLLSLRKSELDTPKVSPAARTKAISCCLAPLT